MVAAALIFPLSSPDLFRGSIVPILGQWSVCTMDRRNESGDDKKVSRQASHRARLRRRAV
jgi:hypothetical protein